MSRTQTHQTNPSATHMREQVLHEALLLACRRIADGPQQRHEANTPDGWADVFIQAAESGQTTDDVLAARPPARAMTDEDRQRFGLM